ncbi:MULTISPECIES: hypothetical protein [Bradyrhizobium]|uniref:hypothetical protein n=1 Tax=Bradyrhizobium TaxID=374 RepID=UPI0003139E51|nr:hypothetical protein [Bradyrhizobium japonicum]MCS3539469.1 ABC-type transport system involved in multi-copper enzyme maturation permease subunit [Bradyrhizobium japonicum]MCS3993328.1 ABC-type transport system involved in multi-copper enzyme maturation permease subunit [Bradyrhizobium japonicum]MCS4020739.1 ABC-type transport system involved in multi-copper enzyme maturation permease subunit [Bradyrhizobium japonicum]MCS4207848.1 ABC-type transport system involved in multi-copper enzyme mat
MKTFAIVIGVIGAATLTLTRSSGTATTIGDLLIAAFILAWAILTLGIRQLDKTLRRCLSLACSAPSAAFARRNWPRH